MPNATLGELPVDASVSIRRDHQGMTVGHGSFTGSLQLERIAQSREIVYEGPVDYLGEPRRMKGRVIVNRITTRNLGGGSVLGTFVLADPPDWVQ